MKNRIFNIILFFSLSSLVLVSCNNEKSVRVEEDVTIETQNVETEVEQEPFSAKVFFSDKGCIACHQANTKTTGPSLSEITKGYDGDKEALAHFLYGETGAIIDPTKAPLMDPQIKMTQDLSEEEMDALIDFIFSHKAE